MSDFLEANVETIDSNVGNEIGKMLRILHDKRAEIAEVDAKLKLLKADELNMLRVTIPQVFKKHNIFDLTTGEGEVTIKEELTCELVKDEEKRGPLLVWLADNGGEDLIQDLLTIESPSPALLEMLNKNGVLYSIKKDVNTNSLKAWFREKLGYKAGIIATLKQEDVPKGFGLFIYDLARIKEPKGRG